MRRFFFKAMRLLRFSFMSPCHPSEKKQRIVVSRARNPRFYFVHARIAGTKPRFLTKMRHQKIGDSVFWLCHRVRACDFCKPILQIFYPYTNASIRKSNTSASAVGNSPPFWDESPFHEYRLKFWGKCLKLRFVPKRGRVADG
jgi:hypothetical protein